ncbi:hypothetical protein Bbelb_320910 [Branchiostoma belcheri]|nr:hypothetical protein Bbelb_320910 [Branchiostoma belcheri]
MNPRQAGPGCRHMEDIDPPDSSYESVANRSVLGAIWPEEFGGSDLLMHYTKTGDEHKTASSHERSLPGMPFGNVKASPGLALNNGPRHREYVKVSVLYPCAEEMERLMFSQQLLCSKRSRPCDGPGISQPHSRASTGGIASTIST